MQRATADGFRVLVSPDGPWYLDGLGTSWQDMYLLEPSKGITDPAQLSLILGGESCMWGETVDASVILATIWPRAAAVAERLWSRMTLNDTAAAEPRYAWFRCLLDLRGIEAGTLQEPGGQGGASGSWRLSHAVSEKHSERVSRGLAMLRGEDEQPMIMTVRRL